MSKERKNCMCTAMLYDPKDHYEPEETKESFRRKSKLYERLLRWKQRFFKEKNNKDGGGNSSVKPKSLLQYFLNF